MSSQWQNYFIDSAITELNYSVLRAFYERDSCCLIYSFIHVFQCDVLEMDQFTHTLVPFPLLASPGDYFPDTQDLTVDTEAREYWLQCFEDALDKVRLIVLKSLGFNFNVLDFLLIKADFGIEMRHLNVEFTD